VVWEDLTPGNSEVFFKRSTDNGASWKVSINLSSNRGRSHHPLIAVSGVNVYVFWLQDKAAGRAFDVFFRRSTDDGATWGSVVPLSTINQNFETTARIIAIGAKVFVVWNEALEGDILLKRSTNSGSTFKAVLNLSKTHGARAPNIAVVRNSLFVTWTDNSSGNGDILFKRS
jgi:hypothetical protein